MACDIVDEMDEMDMVNVENCIMIHRKLKIGFFSPNRKGLRRRIIHRTNNFHTVIYRYNYRLLDEGFKGRGKEIETNRQNYHASA